MSPLRITGSAVEILFSQFKYSDGGNWIRLTIQKSRAAYLVKQCVSTHHLGKGYHDAILSNSFISIKKKQNTTGIVHMYIYSLSSHAVKVDYL